MKLHDSARKHYRRDRLRDQDLRHAARNAVVRDPLDDDDPRRWLLLGFDESGRLLEMIVLVFDSGNEMMIHAMKARPQYAALLG